MKQVGAELQQDKHILGHRLTGLSPGMILFDLDLTYVFLVYSMFSTIFVFCTKFYNSSFLLIQADLWID